MPLSVRIAKRLMDIAISLATLVLFFPLLALIALAIKLDSQGPVFYSQKRVKRCGSYDFKDMCEPAEEDTFFMHKFRTMVQNAEHQTGAVNAVENDPRVTRVGKYLRASRIDEIPNLINVLTGEMSIIGPRADRIEIFEEVKEDFPMVWNRTKYVKPGITGDAQIHLRSNGSLNGNRVFAECLPEHDVDAPINSFRYKLYYDAAYAMKLSTFWSFLKTDIGIIIKTPYVMFVRRNVI